MIQMRLLACSRACLYLGIVLSVVALYTFLHNQGTQECTITEKVNVQEPNVVTTCKTAQCGSIRDKTLASAMEGYIGPSVLPDNSQLIANIRQHFIDNPRPFVTKFSMPIVDTPQAKEVVKILKDKHNGFFVECGALDGERSSNSIWLEQKRGWNGLLVEMDPSYYLQVRGKNRKCYSINSCLSPETFPTKQAEKKRERASVTTTVKAAHSFALDEADKVGFGKYKGMTREELLNSDNGLHKSDLKSYVIKCRDVAPGSMLGKLQAYVRLRTRAPSLPVPPPEYATDELADWELAAHMDALSPSKSVVQDILPLVSKR